MQPLVPPVNFGLVEEDLFRSGQPVELNFAFLEQLGLRTVVYLATDTGGPSRTLVTFTEEHDITLKVLGHSVAHSNTWTPIAEETVLAALKLILDKENYPLLVMCHSGRNLTGTLIGCLRKLQRWNLTSIFEEYRRFAGTKVHLLNEQFIEFFDTDLVSTPKEF